MELGVRRSRPPAVADAAQRILGDVEELSRQATATVLESIPSYRDHEDELARSAIHTMRTFLDYAISGIPPGELELARLQDVGRRRAEGRIPIADVLGAYRVSARTILGALAGTSSTLTPEAVLWLAEALFAYIDMVSRLVTDRYAETQADLLRAQEARRREFLSDLLHGHRRGAEALADAASLGIELLGESRVLVAGRRDPGHDLDDDAEKRVEDLLAPTPVLTVRIAGDLVVLPLGPADPSAVVEELGDVLVGDGRIHPGLDGIRNSYAERRARDLSRVSTSWSSTGSCAKTRRSSPSSWLKLSGSSRATTLAAEPTYCAPSKSGRPKGGARRLPLRCSTFIPIPSPTAWGASRS
jgi:hypothetical protein